MSTISIVVPCYNEQEVLPLFYKEITRVADEMKAAHDVDFELVFVDDGSRDGTLALLRQMSSEDARVHYLSFSRNFGKEAAIYAGLSHTTGEYVGLMDADLQDPPALLEEMYLGIVRDGHDCVATCRSTRKGEPPIRSFFARCFYRLINKISKANIVDGARDFRLMKRVMVDAILSMAEYNRFSKGIFGWIGFDIHWISYENVERAAGQTKWSFWKLFLYSLEGIVAFSTAPLAIASIMGIFFCFLAFVFLCVVFVKTLLFGDPVAGYPSLICVILFIGGIQLLCTGIAGQYIAKMYLETKKRPIYIIKEEK